MRFKIVAACARVTGCVGLKSVVAPDATYPRCAMYSISATYALEMLALSLNVTFSDFTGASGFIFFTKLAAEATNSSRSIALAGANVDFVVPSITPAAPTNLIAVLDQRSLSTSE